MSLTAVHGCGKCQGCLERESIYQWRCINCGKRYWNGSRRTFLHDFTAATLGRLSDADLILDQGRQSRKRKDLHGRERLLLQPQ